MTDGLIPAHAGKTPAPKTGVTESRAHPRSRGENRGRRGMGLRPEGSSPLTRGKRSGRCPGPACSRLIPAHAGKTPVPIQPNQVARAHPRSRGENHVRGHRLVAVQGSSPLTRGKHRLQERGRGPHGLIPAHAGKTTECSPGSPTRRAHPRSRGENLPPGARVEGWAGSSPLTRGKPHGR